MVDRRSVVATGRGDDAAAERFCYAAVRRLNANQPEEIAWMCSGAADRGHYVAIFRKTKDGEVVTRRYTHAQAESAAEAVRLGWAESKDPRAVEEYEARTLEGATGATEVSLPPPDGFLQEIGRIFSVGYTGTLQGRTGPWRHTFEGEAGPILYADQSGRLYVAGGAYRVTDVGIVDGAAPSHPGGFEASDFPPVDEPPPWGLGEPTGMTEDEIFGPEPGVPF